MLRATFALFVAFGGVLALPFQTQAQSGPATPSIAIVELPPWDPGGPDKLGRIAGTSAGACADCAVVLFSKGDTWYVQPFEAAPYTEIGPDGRWAAGIHLGTGYAALLVRRSYRPPSRLTALPPVGGDVLAVAAEQASGGAAAMERSGKTLLFAGFSWSVKTSSGPVGPGPNVFAGENAWVDAAGMLHLKIARQRGQWTCAEVVNEKSLGYGRYTFTVDAPELPPEAVLGLFTWDEATTPYHNREIDIEVSRWRDPKNKNGQFVIQPYTEPANIVRFEIPPGPAIHTFLWKPGRVSCRSARAGSKTIYQHTFTAGIPPAGGEHARINLWLAGAEAPSGGEPAEVVIRAFAFKPAR